MQKVNKNIHFRDHMENTGVLKPQAGSAAAHVGLAALEGIPTVSEKQQEAAGAQVTGAGKPSHSTPLWRARLHSLIHWTGIY